MKGAPLIICLAVAAIGVGLSAQTPRPTFDVASIKKIDKPPPPFPPPVIRGGTFTLLATNVVSLIQMAYGVRDFQVVDGPDWIKTEQFEVQARAAGEPARETMLLMLRSLLEDRFGLRLRKDQREMRFFAMVLARSDGRPGQYLHGHTGSGPGPCNPQEFAAIEKARPRPEGNSAMEILSCGTLTALAELASRHVELPVVDRTGLPGRWSARIYYARERNRGADQPDPNLVSFSSALQEQMGLKLEAARGPVDVMVIEAVRQPTEN